MKKAIAFAAIIASSLSLTACNFGTADVEAEENPTTQTEQQPEAQTPEQPSGETAIETQNPE
ncbi:MAG: hypothetical protein CMF61_00795 [Magnetococcales bacterium]|nr:hypothetical protein [Magnetococcales bacterium]